MSMDIQPNPSAEGSVANPWGELPKEFKGKMQRVLLARWACGRLGKPNPSDAEIDTVGIEWLLDLGNAAVFGDLFQEKLAKGEWHVSDLENEAVLADLERELADRRLKKAA